MSWKIYILECGDGSFYTGITNNLEKRFAAHENGSGAKYTRGRGPLTIRYQENCANRSEATKREIAIKKLDRQEKITLISQ
ncbi:MAG: GIY-YIG nuclease family protein [Sneathiella sp.]